MHGNGSVFYIIISLITHIGVEEQGLQLLDTSNRCLCPGDSLTYECTVLGEPHETTVWNGSGFNCTSQEITLFHGSTEGIHGKCGDIVGQSLRSDVDVNATNSNSTTVSHYTSRLTVPINSGTVGRTIECHYDDGQTSTLVGREKLNMTIIGIVNTMDKNTNKKHLH